MSEQMDRTEALARAAELECRDRHADRECADLDIGASVTDDGVSRVHCETCGAVLLKWGDGE